MDSIDRQTRLLCREMLDTTADKERVYADADVFQSGNCLRYGTYPAILGQNFWYWVTENKKRGRNYHDGRYWVCNSIRSLRKTFPSLTAYQIRHAINELINAGSLIKGNYNQTSYDRTTWYAFTDEGTAIFQKAELEKKKTTSPAI